MKGIFCLLAASCLGLALVSLSAPASAAELPARVETSAVNSQLAQFNVDAAGVESLQVATVSLPGHPLEKAANLVRGATRLRPLKASGKSLVAGRERRQNRRAEGRGLARLAPRRLLGRRC